MASRKHIPPAYEGCSLPAPGLIRHGPSPGQRPMEPLPPSEHLENRLAVQAAEIQELVGDNRRLAATHVALRQDLVSAKEEIQRLADHIKSTTTESDIQIRVLMDKIAKMEADIRAGESVKKDLQQAHTEARSLALARKELIAQIEQATRELEKARTDAKRLPEMHAELDSLRQEHQRLRVTFEHEKGLNIDRVERMQIMEKDIMRMASETERLRADVLNAEKRANAPNAYVNANPYISSPSFYPPTVHGAWGYVDPYTRPPQLGAGAMVHGMDPYGVGVMASSAAAPSVIGSGSNPAGMQPYDACHATK
ncbi:hypothetical protein M9H77_06575 [Catharanthus roseus]|uniref:Uncharacterized protein n=1 Tax=Catharanthus roseus TaxID=4058 RepID=A0ACC0BSG8_CATRO|nr:hypothetical protein M9H77_06575 [Catharanthus roseus]